MTTPMEPLKFIISGLIPQGLHILAGSPKIGKSWLALWICLQVAKGEKIWGFETQKCQVLYLCLEDSFARIQSRLFEITEEAPPTLHFAIISDAIGNGLEIQIENFIREHPGTGLIVIDTLQKVRKTVSSNVNPYAADYDDINVLKRIAIKQHCDSFGSPSAEGRRQRSAEYDFRHHRNRRRRGQQLHLAERKRTENAATLICTGRDIEAGSCFLDLTEKPSSGNCSNRLKRRHKSGRGNFSSF